MKVFFLSSLISHHEISFFFSIIFFFILYCSSHKIKSFSLKRKLYRFKSKLIVFNRINTSNQHKSYTAGVIQFLYFDNCFISQATRNTQDFFCFAYCFSSVFVTQRELILLYQETKRHQYCIKPTKLHQVLKNYNNNKH